MKKPIEGEYWYFVDETGDPVFYDERGIEKFETRWAMKVDTKTRVIHQTTVGEPCLQVIDYMNWAVHRAFVKREMRYFDFIADKVSLLVDLYDLQNYPHNWYSRENPFDIKKVSPL